MPIVTTAVISDRETTERLSVRRHPLDGAPADAVVFVLVDALRHDYVSRTRFLARVAGEAVTGQIEEPFGFCPRGAYFGGLTMAAQGYTNLFRYDPEASPFGWTRELATGGPADGPLAAALRGDIVARAKGRVPPFAAAYLDPLQIPLAWLGYFDVCEQLGPASHAVGYRSLFHDLEASGQRWLDVSWPYPGWSGGLSSGRVAGQVLDRLTAEHRFAFVHLPDLDMVGHAAGPGSRALQQALGETDRLCQLIADRVLALHRDPLIVFAGDHGMLPVVRHVDVAGPLAATGLRFGQDVAYFIDSTMVRVWTHTADARARVHAALDGCGGGRWLTDADWVRYELAGIDPRNAGAIYLASPGVLFTPNFFDWSGRAPVRGMHGYAPDVADNRAALLAWRPRAPQPGAAGVVPARTLYPALRAWLGFDVEAASWPAPIVEPRPAGRWSVTGAAGADEVVDAHLATIVERVTAAAPDATAIILAGGFGRGEGTVTTTPSGPRPVNDYDVVVVGGRPGALAGLDAALPAELGIDFVDLWPRPDLTPSAPISQFDIDLRYGASRLWGDPLVLDRLPDYAPADLSLDEGLFQIGNRAGGLLLGLTGWEARPGDDGPGAFLERQRAKFLLALADAWLMAHEDYHPSYAIRRARFAALASGSIAPTVCALVDEAFAAKLEGQPATGTPPDVAGAQCAAAWSALQAALGLDRDPSRLPAALSRTVSERVRGGSDWLAVARGHALIPAAPVVSAPLTAASAIYRAAIAGVAAWPLAPADRHAAVGAALAPEFLTVEAEADALCAGVARTWLGFFHP